MPNLQVILSRNWSAANAKTHMDLGTAVDSAPVWQQSLTTVWAGLLKL